MVFGGDNNAAKTSFFGNGSPLRAVQAIRGKKIVALRTLPPLQTGIGIGPKVGEHIHFFLVPLKLLRRRHGAKGLRILRSAARGCQQN